MKEVLMTPGFCLSHSIWGISLTKMRETKEGWVWGDNEHEHVKSEMPVGHPSANVKKGLPNKVLWVCLPVHQCVNTGHIGKLKSNSHHWVGDNDPVGT